MPRKIKVVIAEDQELMRKSLIALLSDYEHFLVVGEASNGKELLQLLKTVKPDIVLLDVEMPVMNGLEAISILNVRFPTIRVIILSMHNDSGLIVDFMTRGARAYLPKGCDVDTMINTMEMVQKNGFHFSDKVSKAMLTSVMTEKNAYPFLEELSLIDRELEIMRELCEGKTNKEIADTLKITPRTIDFHRTNIYTKTKSRNLAELVKYAIKHGLV
ncbi:MAG: response regulator transcription factor, partial [Bacteroidia bacterium]|nr:response regulator transcription factor [Bacteroidia bacterium]